MWLHFQNAAGDEHEFFGSVFQLDTHRAWLDACDQWRVARLDAELARFTGQGHKGGFTGEDQLFCADDVNMNGCHLGSLKG